jgi:hypothetical protein
MSNYKKVPSYLFYTIIFIAVLLFIYDFIDRHQKKFYIHTKANIAPKVSITIPEVTSLQERIQNNESEIALLKNNIEAINKQAINAEKYSKFFFILSNIEQSLNDDNIIDIGFQIKALENFAINDAKLLNKVNEIDDISTIYGRKYFETTFSRVVRKITKQYSQNEGDHYAIRYIKRHIMPYFAYLSPEGNHISYVLYQAHQKLEQGKMEEVYKLLLSLPTENEIHKDFMSKLEQYVRVEKVINFSKKHIETMLSEESTNV